MKTATHLLVQAELDHIERSERGSDQNMFRAMYDQLRLHDLKTDRSTPRDVSMSRILAMTAELLPGFTPVFDPDFFQSIPVH